MHRQLGTRPLTATISVSSNCLIQWWVVRYWFMKFIRSSSQQAKNRRWRKRSSRTVMSTFCTWISDQRASWFVSRITSLHFCSYRRRWMATIWSCLLLILRMRINGDYERQSPTNSMCLLCFQYFTWGEVRLGLPISQSYEVNLDRNGAKPRKEGDCRGSYTSLLGAPRVGNWFSSRTT